MINEERNSSKEIKKYFSDLRIPKRWIVSSANNIFFIEKRSMKFKPVLFSLPKIPSKKILLIPQDETKCHY